jgi:hypothetical protein
LAQVIIEKRRYAILRHLYDTSNRELGISFLKAGCRAQGVVPTDDDEVRTAVSWLADNGLVSAQDQSGFATARLTPAGADVLTGNMTVSGLLPFGDPV